MTANKLDLCTPVLLQYSARWIFLLLQYIQYSAEASLQMSWIYVLLQNCTVQCISIKTSRPNICALRVQCIFYSSIATNQLDIQYILSQNRATQRYHYKSAGHMYSYSTVLYRSTYQNKFAGQMYYYSSVECCPEIHITKIDEYMISCSIIRSAEVSQQDSLINVLLQYVH